MTAPSASCSRCRRELAIEPPAGGELLCLVCAAAAGHELEAVIATATLAAVRAEIAALRAMALAPAGRN